MGIILWCGNLYREIPTSRSGWVARKRLSKNLEIEVSLMQFTYGNYFLKWYLLSYWFHKQKLPFLKVCKGVVLHYKRTLYIYNNFILTELVSQTYPSHILWLSQMLGTLTLCFINWYKSSPHWLYTFLYLEIAFLVSSFPLVFPPSISSFILYFCVSL